MQNSKNLRNANSEPKQESKTSKQNTGASAGINLKAPGMAKQSARLISEAIDAYCKTEYDDGHRWHLGASLIGDDCKRKLWYVFRWCYREQFDGRMQRLFNRGHREEERFIEWLEGIGCKVYFENRDGLYYVEESDEYGIFKADTSDMIRNIAQTITEDNPRYKEHVARAKLQGITFPQYRVSGVGGHFGGSLDAIIILPEWLGIPEPVLGEFKTNGTGAGFNELTEKGMKLKKPQHYAQTSVYGSDPNYQFKWALYLNINKNDDTIHVELVSLDWDLGNQMRQKAEQIIMSQEPPPRLSDNPTYRICTYCAAKDICHRGAIPEKNCRSCKNCSPAEGGEWFCSVYNGVIPRDFVKTGCAENYIPITVRTNV